MEEVLALEENKFLQVEERIMDDFLWVYPADTIKFPGEEEKTREEEQEETAW